MAFEIENGVLKNYTEEDGVTEVVIPDSVTTIGKEAFYGCRSLTSVTIPDSVTTIGDWAFRCCRSLTSVTIPNSVTEIGWCAFCECESLTEVTIPDSVTKIYGCAFSGTKWLEEYPEDLVIVGNGILIRYKGKDENVVIPDSVTEIGYEAFGISFFDNYFIFNSLKSVTIKGVTFKVDFKKFCKDVVEAYKLPETKDFSAKLYTPLKYAVIVGYYLESGDADAEAFIKKGIKRIMTFLIDGDNVGTILKLLETGKFVTDKNILTFIDYANSLQKMEIQLIFMNYSHEHFKPKKTNFKL